MELIYNQWGKAAAEKKTFVTKDSVIFKSWPRSPPDV